MMILLSRIPLAQAVYVLLLCRHLQLSLIILDSGTKRKMSGPANDQTQNKKL